MGVIVMGCESPAQNWGHVIADTRYCGRYCGHSSPAGGLALGWLRVGVGRNTVAEKSVASGSLMTCRLSATEPQRKQKIASTQAFEAEETMGGDRQSVVATNPREISLTKGLPGEQPVNRKRQLLPGSELDSGVC
jgi:hypothetical protein